MEPATDEVVALAGKFKDLAQAKVGKELAKKGLVPYNEDLHELEDITMLVSIEFAYKANTKLGQMAKERGLSIIKESWISALMRSLDMREPLSEYCYTDADDKQGGDDGDEGGDDKNPKDKPYKIPEDKETTDVQAGVSLGFF